MTVKNRVFLEWLSECSFWTHRGHDPFILSCTIYQVISVRSINKRMFKHPIRFQTSFKMTSNDPKMTYFRIKIRAFPIMYQKNPKISKSRARKGIASDHNVFLCNPFKSSRSFGASDTAAAYAPSTTCFWCFEYHHYSIASFGMKTFFYIIVFFIFIW